MQKKRIIQGALLLLILLQLCVIFKLSHEPAAQSDQTSGGFIQMLLEILDASFSEKDSATQAAEIQRMQNGVRTLAHASEYALLGLTAAGFALTFEHKRRALLCAFGACVLWAVSDELHQAFVPGRSCQLSDIAVDSTGALFGAAVLALLWQLLQKRFQRKDGQNGK